MKLKWWRYPENYVKRVSSLLDAIIFDSTIGISISLVFRKLDIHIFPRIPRSAQLEFGKNFKYASEVKPGKKSRLLMSASDLTTIKWLREAEQSLNVYKYPQTPLR